MTRLVLIALVFGALGGCSKDSSKSSPDAPGSGLDAPQPDASTAGFVEAPHGAPPQAVSGGGPVLATPKIVPIFFSGDDTMQAQIETFLAMLATSDYWHTATSEYGVGALTIVPTVVATDAPPTTQAALESWLSSHLDGGTHAGWPAFDSSAIYSVFLPAGTVLQTSFGTSCQAFGGYHFEVAGTQGTSIVYALMPRCGSIGSLTGATSHEFVEASTDPYPQSNTAYQEVDNDHLIWSFTPGGELGDMCEYVGAAKQQLVGDFTVQRTWSNASAAAGHDPCVPVLAAPYIGAAPVLTDDVSIDFGGGNLIGTKGVEIPLNTSKVIEVDLFSDAPTDADWTVKAVDATSLTGDPTELTFSWDATTGHNGDKLHLTITRVKEAEGGSEFVVSSRINDQSQSLWWGFVAN